MIKALFIFIVILSWYVAGIVRSTSIMIYSISLTLFMAAMYITTRIYRKKVLFSYESEYKSVAENVDSVIRINITNNSGMPVSKIRLDICIKYGFYENSAKHVMKQRIFSSCRNKNGNVQFRINMPYAGPACIYVKNAYLYDYTGVFRTRLSVDKHMNIAVMPVITDEDICVSGISHGGDDKHDMHINKAGSSIDDIRQIRDYQTGDSYRHIHWNMSARTGSLLVKEYSDEQDVKVNIVPEVIGEDIKDYYIMGRFYDKLATQAAAFISNNNSVNIMWYDCEYDMFMEHMVITRQDIEDALYELYTYYEKCIEHNEQKNMSKELSDEHSGDDIVVINTRLEVYNYAENRISGY